MVAESPGVPTLLGRIGGRERLRAILDRFYARLFDDVMVGFFFVGHERADIVDGQMQFLLRAFGEEPDRPFRHPREAHDRMPPILRGHFDRRLAVLREVLDEERVDPVAAEAWLRIEESMRKLVQRGRPMRP